MPTYAFSTTRESVDRAVEAFRRVKDLTVKLSMVENAAYRLASNILTYGKSYVGIKFPEFVTL